MTLPTAEQVTNTYLYGSETKPTDIATDSLIRPKDIISPVIDVKLDEYMAGPGRFVLPGSFNVIEYFLNPSLYADSFKLEPGTYSKDQLFSAFGITQGWVNSRCNKNKKNIDPHYHSSNSVPHCAAKTSAQ